MNMVVSKDVKVSTMLSNESNCFVDKQAPTQRAGRFESRSSVLKRPLVVAGVRATQTIAPLTLRADAKHAGTRVLDRSGITASGSKTCLTVELDEALRTTADSSYTSSIRRDEDAMNSRAQSVADLSRRPSYATSLSSRPNTINRRLSALSTAEQGHVEPISQADQAVAEELDEIKRYEDFTTIDWVQDAAREQQRRKARRQERAGFFEREGRLGWRRKVWEAYDAGQGWIVVTLIGAAIGLNAAFLNIVTEWLSDSTLR